MRDLIKEREKEREKERKKDYTIILIKFSKSLKSLKSLKSSKSSKFSKFNYNRISNFDFERVSFKIIKLAYAPENDS